MANDREENAIIRAYLLELLSAAARRQRGPGESPASYVTEDLIYLKAGRRYPMTRETLRTHLWYLRDRDYVKFNTVDAGQPATMWRITADGVDVLDGTRKDPGVHID